MRATRRSMPEGSSLAPESAAASPLAAFLDDAEAALSELREFESESAPPHEPRIARVRPASPRPRS